MKKTTSRLIPVVACFFFVAALAAGEPESEPDEQFLPIGLTEEEKTRLHEIGEQHRATAPPIGALRNPAEWEPSEGVLVRWPLGIPVALVAEMSEDVVVTTIVTNAQAEQTARATYTAGGVNMANAEFIHAPTNSIWVRDYGPWFIFEDDQLAIVDHIYNRPRPLDDVIPQTIGAEWGLTVYGMSLNHAGGNHMSDGLGMSASTELVYNENTDKTPAEIDQTMLDYVGNDYTVLEYIQSGGIHHIDCWAKYLGPSTVMVKDVAPSDPTHDELDARAEFLSQQISPWGVPYDVVRIYCPTGTYYTNSLILNDKVLVPVFGHSQDSVALQTYEDAMPGYEVLGFSGSWASEDALHCRAMGVPDRGMLFIDHDPFRRVDITWGDYEIGATIVATSGAPLIPSELVARYSVDGGLWQEVSLTAGAAPDSYTGQIPAQAEDSIVAYYLEAADESGRRETHPFIGEPSAHRFTAICPNHPLVDVVPDGPLPVCTGTGLLLTAELTGGIGPFAYQWVVDGFVIPGATSSTYIAESAGTHTYQCRVWGDGCLKPRTDVDPVELTWQSEPVFGGLTAISNPQNAVCTLDLAWQPATPACGGPVHYTIYRSTTPQFTPGPATLLVQGVAGTGFSDSAGLEPGRDYHYIVRARDDANGVEDSNTVELSGSPTGPGGTIQTLFEDRFEDPADWANWQVTVGPGPHTCGSWIRTDTTSQRPPGGAGYYALADSDACGSGSYTSTTLTSPAIDCGSPGLVSVSLEYDLYYRHYDGDDATVEVHDGTDWQVVWTAPASSVQAHHTLDVTPYAVGNPAFQVRFNYQNAAWDYWFAVDNVVLSAEEGGVCLTGTGSVVTVPDGGEGGTTPLLAAKIGSDVEVSWDTTTPGCSSTGYHLIWGWGGEVASYVVSGSDCTLDVSGSHLWSTAPDTSGDWAWFLVVGNDGAATESGWGTDSFSNDRSTNPSGECGAMAMSPAACVP
jgi:agmatine/peptidylarginine deiminase